MIALFGAAVALQSFCDRRGWRCCFIGGLAVQRWGESRVTRDVDLTLLTGFGQESDFIDPLLDAYTPRLADAREFALRNRVLLLATSEGVGIDVSLGALPFEELVVRRSTDFSFGPGLEIRTCSAEDLLILKLFAFRPIDVRDAESIVIRRGNRLDWSYVEQQLEPLAEAKEDPAIMVTLKRLRAGL